MERDLDGGYDLLDYQKGPNSFLVQGHSIPLQCSFVVFLRKTRVSSPAPTFAYELILCFISQQNVADEAPRPLVCFTCSFKIPPRDFPGGPVVKNLPANAGDPGSIPGQGRSHILQSS